MPADLGRELRHAAPHPARDVPLAAIEERLRTRRRRRVGGLAGAALVATIAVGGGVAAFSQPDDTRVQVAAGSTKDGHETVGESVTVELPPGWFRLDSADVVDAQLYVGTAPAAPDPGQCGPLPSDDAFVWISEGTRLTDDLPPPRPDDFATAQSGSETTNACNRVAGTSVTSGGWTQQTYAFSEAGRVFTITLKLGSSVTEQRKAEAFAVMNSLQIGPPASTTTTSTVPVPTTEEPTTTTTTTTPTSTTPLPPETDAAVRETFRIWLDTQPRDHPVIGRHIEDYESIKGAIADAAARAPLPLDGYHGRVDSVVLIDGDHAIVTYSILNGGSSVYSANGRAVRIDGVWKVSRDTVCEALAVNGTTCPPRR